MRILQLLLASSLWAVHASATIIQNGQVREHPYPGQAPNVSLDGSWKTYGPDATEISYKGRWDSNHVSCRLSLDSYYALMLILYM